MQLVYLEVTGRVSPTNQNMVVITLINIKNDTIIPNDSYYVTSCLLSYITVE